VGSSQEEVGGHRGDSTVSESSTGTGRLLEVIRGSYRVCGGCLEVVIVFRGGVWR